MDRIGKYSIVGEIGRGGMGVVYRGVDPYIGRTVAIKTIRLDTLGRERGREDALKRFLREAQAAGNLSHPNIVTIYDVGEHEGLIYIAMEHIEGSSLESLLEAGRAFTLEEIAGLFSQLASALDYAHGRGIIHRDIKPANILVGPDLKVSIVDFGIARTAASTMTQTGMLMGTPRYMSPEQIGGRRIDHRSDVFSLGAILYELLARRNPFEGDSITTVIYKIMHADLEPLSAFNKDLPPGLEEVVARALARDPEERYRSGAELLAGLQGCLRTAGPAATGTAVEKIPDPGQTLRLPADSGPVPRPRPAALRGRRLALALAVLAAALAVAYAVLRLARSGAVSGAAGGEIVATGGEQPAAPALGKPEGGDVVPPAPAAEAVATPPAGQPTAAAEMPAAGVSAKDAAMTPRPAREEKKDAVAAAEAKVQTPVAAAAAEIAPLAAARNRWGYLEATLFNGTTVVQIPAGEFTVGSPSGEGDEDEHPAHRVFISGFWLGKTEVTFRQFDAFCADTGRARPDDGGWGRGTRPAINVTWEDADAYCRWLSARSGRSFRLPSEAEWEKAAHGRYPWGRRPPDPSLLNMKGNQDGQAFTAPVGAYPAGASPYGILDLAGNAWEWTGDWYDAAYYRNSPGKDPRGPAMGQTRAVRGGSWANGPELVRSANRSSEIPANRLNVLGFRVAMDE